MIRHSSEDFDRVVEYFQKLQEIIEEAGILPEDIWNMDETGFRIGVGKDQLIITKRKRSHYFSIPENRESATLIEAISAGGRYTPAFIILAGQNHMAHWYHQQELEPETVLRPTPSGYSNDEISLEWIQHFDKHTEKCRKGWKRLLILDGHGSHHTKEFIEYCEKHGIIPFGLPSNLTHLLQPLDVVVFQPLKHYHAKALDLMVRDGLVNITKVEFLGCIQDDGGVENAYPASSWTRIFAIQYAIDCPTNHNERPFKCSVCSKAFARQHDRKRHERLHLGEKRFVCRGALKAGGKWGCGRAFSRVDALARHLRSDLGSECIRPLFDQEREQHRPRTSSVATVSTASTITIVQPIGYDESFAATATPMDLDSNMTCPYLETGIGWTSVVPVSAALPLEYPTLATMSWSPSRSVDPALMPNTLFGFGDGGTSGASARAPDAGAYAEWWSSYAEASSAGDIDDVLTYILLSIAISGSDFKSDCSKWWSKAVRLAITLRLNREDERCSATIVPCVNPVCSCQRRPMEASALDTERKEERRRVFWLLYSLDRHLSLSFNEVLSIPDSYCEVYAPLPELIWENLDAVTPSEMPAQVSPSVEAIQNLLDSYELSVDVVMHCPGVITSRTPTRMHRCSPIGSSAHAEEVCAQPASTSDQSRARLAIVYSTHILHVLHVLLYGKWDAIAMLEDDDGWITSKRFTQCTSHAIAASQSLSTILAIDPELAFMSYLFGIYLLQGSFIFLLFADRLPQLGPNESVQQACENIIRAHEVCVVTLSTEFQV
ncbi:hypothetical protein O9K51_11412 [Purpureocillium lavendulum]|uniref:C2H2-type domain-containing protein n=1 Tax=Purpureocillium lavendulum TaxID=1247861 RepID=A0AB34FAU0_9HYPO|nr:hypothetical protein O9K51_11412 [Purpureocillium lavendulum]